MPSKIFFISPISSCECRAINVMSLKLMEYATSCCFAWFSWANMSFATDTRDCSFSMRKKSGNTFGLLARQVT